MTPNKTQTTNITNPNLNYINYIEKPKGKIKRIHYCNARKTANQPEVSMLPDHVIVLKNFLKLK
jgi:hypothetical protein